MKSRIPRWLPPLVTAAVLVAWLEVAADAAFRTGWDGVSRPAHVSAALLLATAAGTLVALVTGAAFAVFGALERRAARTSSARAAWLAPVAGALVATLLGWGVAFWTFSGARIRGTTAGRVGPFVLLAVCAAGGAILATVVSRRRARLGAVGPAAAAVFASAAYVVAFVLVRIDLTVYVSLYARLHTVLEATAWLLGAAGCFALLRLAALRGGAAERAIRIVAACAAAATAAFVCLAPLRVKVDDALRHAWREPVYIGRMLSRLQIAEGFIRDPRGWRGATMSSVARLRERYDIATTTRSPVWDQPPQEMPAVAEAVRKIRGDREFNVLVYYIDTLRADAAHDAKAMPNVAKFASESLDFRHAYTTGSDTLHALPGMISGSYDLFADHPNDLLRVANAAGYRSALLVAQSAHEFLEKLLPQFRFDETLTVPDYAPGNENVWGYGADQPTAAPMVDRALEWLRGRAPEDKFLLWMFNFDVHNWRELDEAYAREVAKHHGLLDESDPIWRYKAIARAVDTQLGRLLEGLRESGRADDTLVVVVSDHGEALGRDGFWVHSVFLWESLVHVPLLLRIPGVPPRRIDDVVSLVDLAPTLSRAMAKNADTTGHQGEDLLTYLVPGRPKRRLPLVLMATLKEVPVRIGLVDPTSRLKLVLPLEGAVPELYDLRAPDPDAVDVSTERETEMLRLLNELVRAPLFPRLSEAGSGPLDQAAREGRTAIDLEAEKRRLAAEVAPMPSAVPLPVSSAEAVVAP